MIAYISDMRVYEKFNALIQFLAIFKISIHTINFFVHIKIEMRKQKIKE